MSWSEDNNNKGKDTKGRAYREYKETRYTEVGSVVLFRKTKKDGNQTKAMFGSASGLSYTLVLRGDGAAELFLTKETKKGLEP